jgi:hypothetical protein
LGLGKRIRNPSSDHHFNDNYHDGCANNHDGCAYNHHGCADIDNNHIDNDYDHHHRPWLTSLYGCKGCIFLELGL